MQVVLVAALTRGRVIGRQGRLPWHYPADLRHFRRLTLGHPVVMGRRTFESLAGPLSGRINLVLSRDPSYAVPAGVVRCASLEEAYRHCRSIGAERVFVIGGAQVFAATLPTADEMALTWVPDETAGDAHFPAWPEGEWRVVDTLAREGLRFVRYRRRGGAPAAPEPSHHPIEEALRMFGQLDMAPPDPILGLTEAFKKDPNPAKINLGVGVYKDEQGNTPVLQAVKRAEERLLAGEKSKNYLAIDGAPEYGRAVQELLFGPSDPVLASGRLATVHTPGGTGALRVAADLLHRSFPKARVWISEPTWANHPQVFRAAGLTVETYPYFDAATNGLAWEPMLAALERIPAGDVVLLHGCCHNPTGVDPAPAQWQRVAEVIRRRELLPLVDFAYQGLGDGLREDAAGLTALCQAGAELFVASSFSKNFGLYNERVGALTAVAASPEAAARVLSHLKVCIRANYSNPPAHGAAIIAAVWGDPELRPQWERELAAMRDRINAMRRRFVEALRARGVARDFSFIGRQRGMFSFSGLTKEQVAALRQRYAIYIVDSGRINVAGMTEGNLDALCTAIAAVL